MNTWDDETIATLRQFWTAGLSAAEIGRRMGFTKNSVIGKAHRLGLEERPSPIRTGVRPKPVFSPELVSTISTSLLNGVPVLHIAAKTGASRNTVERIRATLPPIPKAVKKTLAAPPVEQAVDPVALPSARIIYMPPAPGRCEWLQGTKPFLRCESMAATGEHLKRPHSYCMEHRRMAYATSQEERAA